MGEKIEKQILKESQKKTEYLLFEEKSVVKHPYALAVDLYQSTLVSLAACGAIDLIVKSGIYENDESKLTNIIIQLERILEERSPGSYLNVILQFSQTSDDLLQAKL